MDGVEIKLLMSFLTSSGKKVSLFVTDPRDDIKESEIKAVMDLIIEKNIFAPNGGDIVSAKEAKIVQTETTEFDLVVAYHMKHHKCHSELLRGFLSTLKVYLEEYIIETRFNEFSV